MIKMYAAGNAVIKHREGFTFFPPLGIIPKPYQLWDETSKNAILPLLLIEMCVLGLRMSSQYHIGVELCFWYFLVDAGANQQSWFRSSAFKIWVVGSCIAVIYMPLVTTFSRADPFHSEAFTFLAGSLGSLCLTLWFIPILWTFPRFLKNLDGVDMAMIIRLTKFIELNRLTERNLSAHNNSEASVSIGERNPVQNFTSPLDFVYRTAEVNPTNSSMLTFNRPWGVRD
ncbi:hypothetical protein BDN72DRAFT_802708 [Pluteus cervinus]|uniref:Uncharacterized protein n=1 Tax=Pluteus cervinus TaxID=181527 RepID=A0ACD3AF08_9AGAR|nr:hypothetical protein BDN72DRAFT_802708 [Pluteus cervinus]